MSMIGNFVAISHAKLRHLIDNPSALIELVVADDDELPRLDIDKAWHGLHFLLTGEAWDGPAPLGLAILGGATTSAMISAMGPPGFCSHRTSPLSLWHCRH